MRLFYALRFPPAVQREIAARREPLRRAAISGRFPPKENFHMTLQFLGECPERELPALRDILREAAAGQGPFSLTLDRVGSFRGRERERLFWLGGESPEAERLARALEAGLTASGVSPEHRRFVAHVTLARRCVLPEGVRVPDPEPLTISVSALCLMRTIQGRDGVSYRQIAKAPLGG